LIKKLSTESKNKLPVILLFGPTAVGKTALVEQFFSRHFEIVNADSMQVYRYLDIGTAKPSPEFRRRIPHHLIDIRNPDEQYDVGEFVKDADATVRKIYSRGKMPLITGGTAFYFYHFLYGLPPAPPSDPEIRDSLFRKLREDGRKKLYSELEKHDPVSAAKLHPHDTQRILRALEVLYGSGKPLSSYSHTPVLRRGYEYLIIGLYRDRNELYERINRRVEQMWSAGLVSEVRNLIKLGYKAGDPGMHGIGYREFYEMQGAGELLYTDIKREIQKNSRRYAKRQITFFKRIPEAEWFSPKDSSALQTRVTAFAGRFQGEGEGDFV